MALLTPKPPNLPLAPVTAYSSQYQEQFNNVLRLYFNQLSNVEGALLSPLGMQYLNAPYAAIQRTTSKTFTANTATQITFDQNDYINGCTNDGTDGIVVEKPGIYNYQFSVQWGNSDSQAHDAWVWLRINGADVAGTGSQFTVPSKHGAVNGALIAAANFYVSLQANQYVSMYAAVNNTGVTMDATAAQTVPPAAFAMPAIPSVVATLSFVSSLLT